MLGEAGPTKANTARCHFHVESHRGKVAGTIQPRAQTSTPEFRDRLVYSVVTQPTALAPTWELLRAPSGFAVWSSQSSATEAQRGPGGTAFLVFLGCERAPHTPRCRQGPLTCRSPFRGQQRSSREPGLSDAPASDAMMSPDHPIGRRQRKSRRTDLHTSQAPGIEPRSRFQLRTAPDGSSDVLRLSATQSPPAAPRRRCGRHL